MILKVSPGPKEKPALETWAEANNGTYKLTGDPELADISTVVPFCLGKERAVGATVSFLRDGHVATLFDYSFPPSTNSQLVVGESCHVMFMETGLTDSPAPVSISRTTHHGAGLLAMASEHIDRVKFESITFNKAFVASSKNPKFAFDLITNQMMEALLKWNPMTLIWDNGYIIYVGMMPWELAVANIGWIQKQLIAIVDLTPNYLLKKPTEAQAPTKVKPLNQIPLAVEPAVVIEHFAPHRPYSSDQETAS